VGVLTVLAFLVISRKLGRESFTKSRCSQQEHIDTYTYTYRYIYIYTQRYI